VDVYSLRGGLREAARELNSQAHQSGDLEPVILGYSLGGRLALHALMEAGHPWRAAIIVSSHPGLTDPVERERRLAADAEWSRRAVEEPWDVFLRAWDSQPVLGGPVSKNDRSGLVARRVEVAGAFERWSLGRQEDLRERSGAIACPVLWVNGSRDERYVALGMEACRGIPDAEHVVIDGCGHRVPWEMQDELRRVILQFQKRIGVLH